ncbi:MAG: hypothetical protein ACOYVD_02810 [Bacillota bacterium]
MYVLLLIAAFAGIVVFEVPGLIYRKYWKELIIFFIFLGGAFVLSLLPIIGVKIPSPARGIAAVVKFILNVISNILG